MIGQMNKGTAMGAAQRRPVFAESRSRTTRVPEPPMAPQRVYPRVRRYVGTSLLELLVALSLLASSLLGVAATQLAALRDADAQARGEQALWMAFSIAETMATPEWAAPMLARSQASVETLLPGARVSLANETSDIGAAVVQWPRQGGTQVPAPSRNAGACGLAWDNRAIHCVVQPFAVAGA